MSDRPNIYFICVHKGASTFVAAHLLPSLARRSPDYSTFMVGKNYVEWFHANREQLGLHPTIDKTVLSRRLVRMLADNPLPRSNCLVGRLYPDHLPAICRHLGESFPPGNSRVFVMRRDPRDAMVSMYYSLAFSHGESALLTGRTRPEFEKRRREMQRVGAYRWIASTLADPDNREIVEEFESCASLLREYSQLVDLPYELLISNPRDWLETFVRCADLESIVDDAWYDSMLQQLVIPETEDVNRHKRRMTPGNWKEIFDEQLSLLINDRIGEQMEQLGYPPEA
jgi:hypothetical protein